jgi:ankyrin repeat protein
MARGKSLILGGMVVLTSMTALQAQTVRSKQTPTATVSKQNWLKEQLWEAANQQNCARVKRLLEQGADPNTRYPFPRDSISAQAGAFQGTVLMEAAALGDEPTLKALLAHGAFINARGMSLYAGGRGRYQDSSALIEACLRSDNEEVIRTLVEHGANVNVHDKSGTTPLSASSWQSEWAIALFLVDHGARSTRVERKLIMAHLGTN